MAGAGGGKQKTEVGLARVAGWFMSVVGNRTPQSWRVLPSCPLPISPPPGFALAARLDFMVSGHVAFPKQNSRVLAGATEILARLGEESAFVKPGNPTNGDSLSMNS